LDRSRSPIRSFITAAALLVNVTARIARPGTPFSMRYAARYVITRVLPVPAPASTSSGPSVVSTASRWRSFNGSRSDVASGELLKREFYLTDEKSAICDPAGRSAKRGFLHVYVSAAEASARTLLQSVALREALSLHETIEITSVAPKNCRRNGRRRTVRCGFPRLLRSLVSFRH